MKILLETTEKYLVTDEFEVDSMIEEFKQSDVATLVDHKVSLKETKTDSYYIVSLKMRYKTLSEAKESI